MLSLNNRWADSNLSGSGYPGQAAPRKRHSSNSPPQPRKVLLIEDNPGDMWLIREMLQEANPDSFEVAHTDRLSAGLARLAGEDPDLVLLDLGLPDSQGLDTLTRVVAQKPQVPIVVLTGLANEDLALRAVQFGAQDYLLKGQLNGPMLVRVMRYAMERKRAQETQRAAAQRWQTTFDAIGDAVCLLDPECRIVKVNQAMLDLVNQPAPEVLGRRCWEIMHDTPGPIDDCPLARMRQTGRRETLILPVGDRWLQVTADPILNGTGALAGAVHIITDITARRQTEETLQKWAHIFEHAGWGIAVANPDSNVLGLMNPAFARMYGYTVEELTGRPLQEIYTPESWADLPEHIALTHEKGHHAFETLHRRKDGTVFPVEVEVSAVKDEAGHVLYRAAHVQDITERQRTEAALKDSLAKLERTLQGTVAALSATVETRDPYTSGHQQRVAQLACAIAKELGFAEDWLEGLRVTAFLHDIGKIAIPAEILSKPGKLSEYEMSLVQIHAQTGYQILQGIEFPWPVAQIVLQHHERLNGSGYPAGLSGPGIMPEARILAVADVVEAIASHRPYRPALGIEAALEEIDRQRGILYDPEAAEACLRLFRVKGFAFE